MHLRVNLVWGRWTGINPAELHSWGFEGVDGRNRAEASRGALSTHVFFHSPGSRPATVAGMS